MKAPALSTVYRHLFTILLLGCAWASAAEAAPASARPNVVIVLIDDLGWTDLGCYGSKFYRTPNIDRLAAEGLRFTQAYSACPVCSPTRAALMTGKYPARLHLTDYYPGQPDRPMRRLLRAESRGELPLEEITLAERLKQAGYATAAIGKWHLGGEGFEPTRQGFDLRIAGDAIGSPADYFAPYRNREGRGMPGLETAPEGEYLTDRLTAEAEKFIEANKARPFFLYLPHFAVHTPLKAKPGLVARYQAAPPSGLQRNPIYAAMIESMDESVGRIVRKLESLDLARDTIVIFTSDNGGLATGEGPNTPATNNAPLREGKGYLYEGGIRVPLIVKWPSTVTPGTSDIVTSTIDLAPTVAAICGVEADGSGAIDGVSLEPVLRGKGAPDPRSLFWHYPHYSPQGGKPGGAIREGDFKLVEFYEQGRRELFNIAKDTSENTNLIDREPQRAAQMAARLMAWLKEVDAQMPRPNPEFTPDTQAADGTITLAAATAEVHGVMLRHEPLPHKRTLGFWVRQDDWVSWDLQVSRPGMFQLEVLYGCGTGSGGSQVDLSLADQTLSMAIEETGGFQQFVPRTVGILKIAAAGRYTLAVKPRIKPGAAVMDLRQVRLVPVQGGEAQQ